MQRRVGWNLVALAVLLAVFLLWRGRGPVDVDGPPIPPSPRGEAPAPDVSDVSDVSDATLKGAPPPPVASLPDRREDGPVVSPPVHARLLGRVVDDRRRPVADAVVTLRDEGTRIAETRTDAAGTWRLATDVTFEADRITHHAIAAMVWRAFFVHAEDGAGRVGMVSARVPDSGLGAEPYDLGPLVLRAAHPITILVTADGAPIANAVVRIGGTPSETSGRWHWIAATRTDAAGLAHVTGIPAGTCTAVASAPGRASNVAATSVPREGGDPITVDLPAARSLEVAVVEGPTGAPIESAAVSLRFAAPQPDHGWTAFRPEVEIAPTNAEGLTHVPAFAPGVRARAVATASGRPRMMNRRYQAEIPPDAARVTIELEAPTSISFPVIPGDGPVPAEGSVVGLGERRLTMRRWVTPPTGTIHDGHLVVPGAVAETRNAPIEWTARLADGRFAFPEVAQGETEGREIAFRTPRSVAVRVTDTSGEPVSGVTVHTRGLGAAFRPPPTVTDAQGNARLDGLPPEPTTVHVSSHAEYLAAQSEDVDLSEGDAEVSFEVPTTRNLRIRVLVDEEPRLPPTWRLQVGEARFSHRAFAEDPERGELRVRLRTADALVGMQATLEADAYGSAAGTVVAATDEADAEVTLALDSRAILEAQVDPPADGRFEVWLEQYSEAYSMWLAQGHPVKPGEADPTAFSFGPLGPGRYRLRERFTNLVSAETTIAGGGRPEPLRWNLSAVGSVRGRVEVPRGTNPADVGILVEGLVSGTSGTSGTSGAVPIQPMAPGRALLPPGARGIGADGRFEVRVPGDRDVTLEAWHPLHRSAGVVVVRAPRDDVVLRLDAAPTATFTLGAEVDDARTSSVVTRVLLFRGPPGGEPAYTLTPVTQDRRAVFGGYEAGTYTVWIDTLHFAPLVRSSVALPNGETDLGLVSFTKGSTVHLDVRTRDGADRPPMRMHAGRLDEPTYARAALLLGPARAEVSGLGPGRFEIFVIRLGDPGSGPPVLLKEEIEVDGVHDTTVVLDLTR